MVDYTCIRCGYQTHDKTRMKNHFSRKNLCKPKLNDVDINLYKDNILLGLPDVLSTTNTTTIDDNIFKCEYCSKIFKYKQTYYKHLNKCNEKNQVEEVKISMENLVKLLNQQINTYKSELDKRDKQINELIQKSGIINCNNINIQNNINLLSYYKTDISHLTDKDYIHCLNHLNFCIPNLIKKIHFNPKKPENHNIFISNIKNNYVMVYDGKKWNLQNRNESIGDLIDEKELIIDQKLEEWVANGNQYPDIMNKFNNYLHKKENDDILNKIKDEIQLLLFNNRSLIKN